MMAMAGNIIVEQVASTYTDIAGPWNAIKYFGYLIAES